MKKKNKFIGELKDILYAFAYTGIFWLLFNVNEYPSLEFFVFISLFYGLYAHFRVVRIK